MEVSQSCFFPGSRSVRNEMPVANSAANSSVGSNAIVRTSEMSMGDSSRQHEEQRNHHHAFCQEELLRKLRSEAVRLATFRSWTNLAVTPVLLARAGFFYVGESDRVQCAFCLGIIEEWIPSDIPLIEHKRIFPRCPFVCGLPVGNVPLLDHSHGIRNSQETPSVPLVLGRIEVVGIRPPSGVCNGSSQENGANEISRNQQDFGSMGSSSSRRRANPGPNNITLKPGNEFKDLGVQIRSPPWMPRYMTVDARMKTFKTWPRGLSQKPVEMAEAGWFYTGMSDTVMCYHCGGRLMGWDTALDPWVEHAKWYPDCHHLNVVKGRDFVEDVKRRIRNRNREALISGKEKKPVAESLDEDVNGQKFSSDSESSQESGYSSHDSRSEGSSPEPMSPEAVEEDKSFFKPCDAGDTVSGTGEKEIDVNPELVCKICLVRKVCIVILPCGHLCSCPECAPALKNCPICRQPFRGFVRTYLS